MSSSGSFYLMLPRNSVQLDLPEEQPCTLFTATTQEFEGVHPTVATSILLSKEEKCAQDIDPIHSYNSSVTVRYLELSVDRPALIALQLLTSSETLHLNLSHS